MRPNSIISKRNLEACEREELISMVEDLQSRLDQKKTELSKAKSKITTIKTRMIKLKATVAYQRKRILELYQ
jgi:hypothetical protein